MVSIFLVPIESFLESLDRDNCVIEIPLVDESSEWELLSLLGHWFKPESFDSVFFSIASDAVFFSS